MRPEETASSEKAKKDVKDAVDSRSSQGKSPARRRYSPPALTSYGRLVDVTLAGTPGAGDSGGGGGIENFPSG